MICATQLIGCFTQVLFNKTQVHFNSKYFYDLFSSLLTKWKKWRTRGFTGKGQDSKEPHLVHEVTWTKSDVCFLGEDQGNVRQPDAGWTPQHCQVPQVLAGHEGEPGSGKKSSFLLVFFFFFPNTNTYELMLFSHLWCTGYIHHRIHVVRQP